MQDFHAAAVRHCDDAILLAGQLRWPNADHLAGFAAECALKQMLIAFLGVQQSSPGKKPFSMVAGKKKEYGHLPTLWSEVGTLLTGRQSPATTLLLAANPFGTWSVHDRYEDGGAVTPATAASRVQMARQLLAHLTAAKIQGGLP